MINVSLTDAEKRIYQKALTKSLESYLVKYYFELNKIATLVGDVVEDSVTESNKAYFNEEIDRLTNDVDDRIQEFVGRFLKGLMKKREGISRRYWIKPTWMKWGGMLLAELADADAYLLVFNKDKYPFARTLNDKNSCMWSSKGDE